jgi:hypothetical protein
LDFFTAALAAFASESTLAKGFLLHELPAVHSFVVTDHAARLLAVRQTVHYREKAPPVKEAGVAKAKGEG